MAIAASRGERFSSVKLAFSVTSSVDIVGSR
jgi:hypothetical protein